jgi:hypothetical protein
MVKSHSSQVPKKSDADNGSLIDEILASKSGFSKSWRSSQTHPDKKKE